MKPTTKPTTARYRGLCASEPTRRRLVRASQGQSALKRHRRSADRIEPRSRERREKREGSEASAASAVAAMPSSKMPPSPK